MRWYAASLALLALLAGGCDQKALVKKVTPPEDDQLARRFIGDLAAGRTDAAIQVLVPQLRQPEAAAGLQQVRDALAEQPIENIELVGAYLQGAAKLSGNTERTVRLTYEIKQAGRWLAALVIITSVDGGPRQIITARVNPLPDSFENMGRFSLAGKPGGHYAFLAAVVAVPVFSLWALVRCLRSRIRRKWLWVLFIALGVARFELNWNTGDLAIRPLYLQLLGAGAMRDGAYGAWVLAVSVPLGAAIFLARRQRLLAAARPAPTPPPVLS